MRYHLVNIRTLVTEGFSEAELRNFCFDTPEFRPVYHELAELTGKATLVRYLLEFADRQGLLNFLLAWAEEQNPTQYERYQPYATDTPQILLTEKNLSRVTWPKLLTAIKTSILSASLN